MRSLSPGPSRYSSPSAGGCGAGFLSSLSLADSGARVQTVSASAAARVETKLLFFMGATSVLIGGRMTASPVDDGAGQRLTLQRLGVDRVGRITGGADCDPHLRGKLVVLDPRHQTGDDALGALE